MNTLIGFRSRFIVRTLLPTLLTIGLFIVSIFFILIPRFEDIIYERKREMIRELTRSTWKILEHWQSLEAQGAVSLDEAKRSAVRQIEWLRYGKEGKDYFWITDADPTMIMHPYRSDLNGTSLRTFEDSHGKRLFVEMAEIVRASGEGFVDYTWQWKDDSSRIVPKLSYVKGFTPWNWIIGTGIYLDDVKAEIASLERQIVVISIGISILTAILLMTITMQHYRTERRRVQAEQNLHESREKYRTLVEASTEGLIMVMGDGEIFRNKALSTMLGYSDDDAVEIPYRDLFPTHPKAQLFDFAGFAPLIGKDLKSERIETKVRTGRGDLLDVLLTLSPISLLQKDGIVVSIRNLSLERRSDDAWLSGHEQPYALMDKLSVGVFRIAPDREGAFLEFNPAAQSMLGAVERDRLFACTFLEFFDDAAEGRSFFDTMHNDGVVHRRTATIRRLDGTKVVAALSVVAQRDPQGIPVSFEGTLTDLSAQHRAEREREHLLSDIRASLAMLSQSVRPFIEAYPSCPITSSIGSALQMMERHQKDAVLVIIGSGEVVGILTERDVRRRAFARQQPLEAPLHTVMTSPVLTLPSSSTVSDVMQFFADHSVSHAVITGTGPAADGVVHEREVQKGFYTSFLMFVHRVESLETLRDIRDYNTRLLHLPQLLIRGGSAVSDITQTTTMISQAITQRLIRLAQAELGPVPVPFAFIVLGSDGRREQTLLTDQDNAIVYADPPPERMEETAAYFLRLGERVCDGLDAVGYSFCKGGIMAKNRPWCQPMSVWKSYFTDWVTTASPQNILDTKIFFDLRRVDGGEDIVHELRSHVRRLLSGNDPFFVFLTESLLAWAIPEGAVKLRSSFDIKKVTVPIVDAVRLLSLRHQISETNTLERLAQLSEKGVLSRKLAQELTELYSFLLRKRLLHQHRLMARGLPPNNEVDPDECSEYDLLIFRKGVTQIDALREKISHDVKGVIVR